MQLSDEPASSPEKSGMGMYGGMSKLVSSHQPITLVGPTLKKIHMSFGLVQNR